MERRNRMICVLGRTCSGKDTLTNRAISFANEQIVVDAADLKAQKKGRCYTFRPVISYTTRPIREKETDGVEHYFITENDYMANYSTKEALAYTEIGENRYFVTVDKINEMFIKNEIPVYIIDPDGLYNMMAKIKNNAINIKKEDIYIVYIKTAEEERMSRYLRRSTVSGVPKAENIVVFDKRNSDEDVNFTAFEDEMFNSHLSDDGVIPTNLIIDNTDQEYFYLNHRILTAAFVEFLRLQ